MTIWIDGEYKKKEDATVSVFDHGFLYGDGAFEGLRVYNKKIFKLEEHIERLYKGLHFLQIKPGIDKSSMMKLCDEIVLKHPSPDAYIRLVVTRGEGPLGLDPTTCKNPSVIIIVADISLYPKEVYSEGLVLITSSLRRLPLDSFDVRVKSLNYINNIMARAEAKRAGAHEAILLNHQGRVAECSGDNLIVVRGKTLLYPEPSNGALEGITLGAIIDLAKKSGFEVRGADLGLYDLYTADEVLLTGTAAELVPVRLIDGRVIGSGDQRPVFDQLKLRFGELVKLRAS